MEARPVDPRDIGWEAKPAAYRVYFWKRLGGDPPKSDASGWMSDEYELTGVGDVSEAIDWASDHSAGRRYTLYAVLEDGARGKGTIRLLGVDRTISSGQ